jgi:hypothetical protein
MILIKWEREEGTESHYQKELHFQISQLVFVARGIQIYKKP